MVGYLNKITPHFVDGFRTKSNMTRCLHNAVFGKRWATTPLNISMVQYNFDQLVIALNESNQLEREIEKTSTYFKTYSRQLTIHPKDIWKYDSSHRSDSRNNGDLGLSARSLTIDMSRPEIHVTVGEPRMPHTGRIRKLDDESMVASVSWPKCNL